MKGVIINMHNLVSKDNLTMVYSGILNNLTKICEIAFYSLRKLVRVLNKLGPDESSQCLETFTNLWIKK